MARIRLEPLRGFRDILYPESRALSRLMLVFAEEAEAHGYEEVKPPTLERFELFALKSGEEIRRSMYVFKDKGGREVALRPEATASIARIYLKYMRGKPKPLRLYYIVNCFRYEEPQRARYREFWQAGVELLGLEGIEADFEVIKLLLSFYNRMNMTDKIILKVGNTRIYRSLFKEQGLPEDEQDRILHLMDKNLYEEAASIIEEKTGNELASTLRKLWTSTRHDTRQARDILLSHSESAARAVEELEEIVDMIKDYSNVKIDVDLAFARGLAYYTGLIFEVKVPGFPVSIAGGGRYDELIELYGDERLPGTGFAIGLDRTLAALEFLGHKPGTVYSERPKAGIVALNAKLVTYASRVQDVLKRKGYAAVLFVERRIGRIIPRLLDQGYTLMVIIGEEEAREQSVTMKDLKSRQQVRVPLEKLSSLHQVSSLFGHGKNKTQ